MGMKMRNWLRRYLGISSFQDQINTIVGTLSNLNYNHRGYEVDGHPLQHISIPRVGGGYKRMLTVDVVERLLEQFPMMYEEGTTTPPRLVMKKNVK